MRKFISIILLLLASIVGKTQTFSYSENRINNPTDVWIIGKVKNNIIVWNKGPENYKRSEILVYDYKMKLVKKVTTDILHSDIDPAVSFYNSADSFYVAYQYKKENKWAYKLAGFDNNGNLSSTYIIDRLSNLNKEDSLLYSYYQPVNKKTLGCVKTIFNKKYNAIRFEFTFLNDGNLYRDSLFLGFDYAHDKIVDLLIDNSNNVTLLKTSNTDSGFIISVIKKEYLADYFLTATKKFTSGNLRNGTSHFFSKLNNYTIYGVWENAFSDSLKKNEKYITGLYTWKINEKLIDMSGGTILFDDSTTISEFNLYTNSFLSNKTDNFFGIQTDSINIPDRSATRQTGQMVFQSIGTNGSGYYNYIPLKPSPEQIFSHYKASFTIVGLNNLNNIKWRSKLENNPDSILLTDLSNNKIVAGKKGIHIVRSNTIKTTINTIEHVLITYEGRYEKINTQVWNNKYTYFVPNAVETDDGALIIPCVKDSRLIFAKMILE